jgi:hypothetical protein
MLAFVTSSYCFLWVDIGWPGTKGDVGALHHSSFMTNINTRPEERARWLGEHGIILGDGAFSSSPFMLTPYRNNNLTSSVQLYNFCFSSTRFFVEEASGRLKNRFRVLLRAMQCSHARACKIIYCCVLLHNLIIDSRGPSASSVDRLASARLLEGSMSSKRCADCTYSILRIR